MLMIYIACAIALCNSSFAVSAHKLPTIYTHSQQTSNSQPRYIITTANSYSTNNQILYLNNNNNNNYITPTAGSAWPVRSETNTQLVELTPLEPTFIGRQQQKSLVRMNTLGASDNELIKKLYDQASSLINSENLNDKYTDKFGVMINDCIDACNKAKQLYGIYEDHLGEFSSQQKMARVALFFSSLKHYNRAISLNNEKKYFHFGEESDLAKALGLSADMIEKPVFTTMAMKLLVEDICTVGVTKHSSLKQLVRFLYSDKKLEQKSYDSIVMDPEWKKSFLYDAFVYFNDKVWDFDGDALDLLIEKVQEAQKMGLLMNEREFGFYALKYEPALWQDGANMSMFYAENKNKISLLSFFIAQYNNARGLKVTPTRSDIQSYLEIQKLHIVLPQAFDAKLLDPEHVAFQEKIKLCRNIKLLLDEDSDHYIKKYVAALYSPQSEHYSSIGLGLGSYSAL